MEKNHLIDMFISNNIWQEYIFHTNRIHESPIKNSNEALIQYLLKKNNNTNSQLDNSITFKVKDKGDKHLLEFAFHNQIPNILSFDKNAFYKSQLKKLNITQLSPDNFILEKFENFKTDGIKVLLMNGLDKDKIITYLRNAQLYKLANSI
jgi:predicted nucleic acid-binding protein